MNTQEAFRKGLETIRRLAGENGGAVTVSEILQAFPGVDLDEDQIGEIYDYLEREENSSYPDEEKYPEPPEAAAAILDMQRKAELLAVTYLGLSAEEAAGLGKMTQGTRAKLVEEGVHHALEQRNQ